MLTPEHQRLTDIALFYEISFSALARRLGLRSPQIFYDIKAGKCGISKDLAHKMQENCPEINIAWLLTGEGEMLKLSQFEETAAAAEKDTISRLLLLTESQQRTIENLSETIKYLTTK